MRTFFGFSASENVLERFNRMHSKIGFSVTDDLESLDRHRWH